MKRVLLVCASALIATALAACGGEGSGSGSQQNTNEGNRAAANSMTHNSMNTGNGAQSVGGTNASTVAVSPEDFLHKAAEGGMTEIEMGKVASQQAQNAEVKKFAQMMVADHTKANEELKGLATKKNVPLPADMGAQKASLAKLKGMSGADFDKAYVQLMVVDHETTVGLFQKQAESATDSEVKAFATKSLPTLKKHLEQIKAIQSKMQ